MTRLRTQDILRGSSKRTTAQRTLLLNLIHQSNGHLDACELYQRAREKHASINLSTVYRNLQLFKNLGLVNQYHFTEEHCHYESKSVAEHQHLVCLSCGKVVDFAYTVSKKIRSDIGRQCNFDIITVEINMTGLCSLCRTKEKR